MILGQSRRSARAAVAVGLLLVTPMQALADASVPYYERSFVLAAHQKCRLFQPVVAAALTTSALQARGAAVRDGVQASTLTETAYRAGARAQDTDCADPDLLIVRDRVAEAFAGWSQTRRMAFPGDWSADRSDYSSPTWRLMQASVTGVSPVTFGYAAQTGQDQTMQAVVSFVGRSRPYAARIVMRDVTRLPRPWIGGNGVADLPPQSARRVVFSTGSRVADPTLLSKDRRNGEAWTFSALASEALATLDPRETFEVEFLFRDDSVARASFQVGDFAAAQAFVSMGAL